MNHEPEDLPGEMTAVPSWAGEQARMKKRVQSSGSLSGLGDFLFARVENSFQLRSHIALSLRRTGPSTSRLVARCGLEGNRRVLARRGWEGEKGELF